MSESEDVVSIIDARPKMFYLSEEHLQHPDLSATAKVVLLALNGGDETIERLMGRTSLAADDVQVALRQLQHYGIVEVTP